MQSCMEKFQPFLFDEAIYIQLIFYSYPVNHIYFQFSFSYFNLNIHVPYKYNQISWKKLQPIPIAMCGIL